MTSDFIGSLFVLLKAKDCNIGKTYVKKQIQKTLIVTSTDEAFSSVLVKLS